MLLKFYHARSFFTAFKLVEKRLELIKKSIQQDKNYLNRFYETYLNYLKETDSDKRKKEMEKLLGFSSRIKSLFYVVLNSSLEIDFQV